MTKKRLIRDAKWGFQTFPYFQMRVECDKFHGWAALNELTDGEYLYWGFRKAGEVPVAGKGMCWLTLIPDGKKRSITAKFKENGDVSVWYVDVIDSVKMEEDGVLDIFYPQVEVQEILPDAMNHISELVHRMNAKVVVISSHRFGGETWESLLEMFRQNDIKDVDVTPSGEEYHSRTEEIKAYLQMHSNIERYVILDDCFQDDYTSDPELLSRLVFVDALKGLQKQDLIKASEILNRQN